MKYWIGKAEVSTLVLILKNYFNEVMHLSGIRSKSIKRKSNIHFYQISKIIKLKFSFHPPTPKDANGFEEIFFLMQGFSVRQFSARILIYIKAIYPAMSFPSSRKKNAPFGSFIKHFINLSYRIYFLLALTFYSF